MTYHCREFDRALCDYLDGALSPAGREAFERHAASCPACARNLEDSRFALELLNQAPQAEPPPELAAEIIHETLGLEAALAGGPRSAGGLSGLLRPLFQPLLQPRFVMSMAMTFLSFSMLTFFGRQAMERWEAEDFNPAAVVERVREHASAVWDEAVTLYETLDMLYRLQVGDREADEAGEEDAPGGGPASPQPDPRKNREAAPEQGAPR